MEEEVEQVTIGHFSGCFCAGQAVLHGGLADALKINTAPVVFHLYIYVVAAMISADGDVAVVALPCLVTLVVAFNTMSHGIAYQVNERIRNLLDDVVIEFRLRTGEREFNSLVYGFGGIAHGAREARLKIADGH